MHNTYLPIFSTYRKELELINKLQRQSLLNITVLGHFIYVLPLHYGSNNLSDQRVVSFQRKSSPTLT